MTPDSKDPRSAPTVRTMRLETGGLIILVLVLVVFVGSRLAGRERGSLVGSSSAPVLAPILTLRLDIARTFERKKRAALEAATAALR
jgi:hypothetical protein